MELCLPLRVWRVLTPHASGHDDHLDLCRFRHRHHQSAGLPTTDSPLYQVIFSFRPPSPPRPWRIFDAGTWILAPSVTFESFFGITIIPSHLNPPPTSSCSSVVDVQRSSLLRQRALLTEPRRLLRAAPPLLFFLTVFSLSLVGGSIMSHAGR